jgi:acetolactate synthase-1/2/3 large subunit
MSIGTGGDALVAGLKTHQIDVVFALPGAQIYGLFDAFCRGGLRVIGARHEQGCGYMAFGYARATGRPAVFSVVPGPGVLNAGAAALTALGCNEPVLCLTGQVPSEFLGKGFGHLHEMPNQLATLATFYKHARRIESAGAASSAVADAFQIMLSGRRGPVALEMPWNVFTEETEIANAPRLAPRSPPLIDTDRIEAAAKIIARSQSPMIFVGSGAIHAAPEIQQLAERIQAPVVAFRSGRGIVSNAHPLGLTIAAAYDLWNDTDLLIGIGTRLEVPRWRWPFRPAGQKSVRIEIDPIEMSRYPTDVSIIADSLAATRALLEAVERNEVIKRNRMSAIKQIRDASLQKVRQIQPQVGYLEILRELLPPEGIVTDELSQVGFASWYGYPVFKPRTFLSSGYQGNLGSGYSTALGAKIAFPDIPVVAICGDGGFMFSVQELATAAQYKIGVVALVFNNNAYGNVLRDQLTNFDGRTVGARLTNPDFVKLARAFGIESASIATPDALRPVLDRALRSNVPWVIEIEVPTGSEANPWRFIHPTKP